MVTFKEGLALGRVFILDGAMGTELERRGVPMHTKAWSAASLITHPDLVRQIHREYIEEGADVIVTNTFAASRNILDEAGLGDRVYEVNALAVELAKEARNQVAKDDVLIAGSMSAMGGRTPTKYQAIANYQEQAFVLAEAGVDLIILETMRDLEHTGYALNAASSTGLPIWVGFQCKTGDDSDTVLLRGFRPGRGGVAGDPDISLEQGLQFLPDKGVDLVAIMHTTPEDTTSALKTVVRNWSGPVGAYPHSGEFTMPNWDFQNILSCEDLLNIVREWVSMGVQVVGGCCGIGPEHIRTLKQALPLYAPSRT